MKGYKKLKRFLIYLILFISILFLNLLGYCQLRSEEGIPISECIVNRNWDAKWITSIEGLYNLKGEGFYLFKKHIELDQVPEHFIIHVSADNRYRLYINGEPVGHGPAQGTISNWQFDTYNIAKFLESGENVISSEVWQWGDRRPWTQLSHRTAFVIQGDSEREACANTDETWLVKKCDAVTFFDVPKTEQPHTTGVGPGEIWEMEKYPYGWNLPGSSISGFIAATALNRARTADHGKNSYEWQLHARRIPFPENKKVRLPRIVFNDDMVSDKFTKGDESIISANANLEIVFACERLMNAYPVLNVSRGKDSKIHVTYAEALVNSDMQKVNRTRMDGLQCRGLYDIFNTDGGENRQFKPLWYRTFKYIKLEIETKDDPLHLHDFYFLTASYPFVLRSSFECNDEVLNKIFETGWWTARMCATDIYMDCPYYERLQYFFDVNVGSQVTTMLSGDVRLLRNAIIYGYDSMQGGNQIMCAAPGREIGKIIPFFSIAWIDLIYSYLVQTARVEDVKEWQNAIYRIMDWYTSHLNCNNLLGPMPYWNFVDCTRMWPWDPANGSICEPTGAKTGNSALLSLQFVYGLERAATVMDHLGEAETARIYRERAGKIKEAVRKLCYDAGEKYFAETPEKVVFSQHTNTMAVLMGCVEGKEACDLLKRMIKDDGLQQMSTQFQNFYHKALIKTGLQQEYTQSLGQWKELIKSGFTTFPEYPNLQTRSDCHMWNSFPAYDLIRIVCGIEPVGIGMKEFEIRPALGDLKWVKGSLFHPSGNIRVNVEKKDGNYSGTVFVPVGTKAKLILEGSTLEIVGGNTVKF